MSGLGVVVEGNVVGNGGEQPLARRSGCGQVGINYSRLAVQQDLFVHLEINGSEEVALVAMTPLSLPLELAQLGSSAVLPLSIPGWDPWLGGSLPAPADSRISEG